MQSVQIQNFFEVRELNNLKHALLHNTYPVHLLLYPSVSGNIDALRNLSLSDAVYSVMVFSASEEIKGFAKTTDTVPVSVVSDAKEAQSVVQNLQADPFGTVDKAPNGEAVSFRYLKGRAT